MLTTLEQATTLIKAGKVLSIAGDEKILSNLPRGNWIAGTIPYFIDERGGTFSRDQVFVTELPTDFTKPAIRFYDEKAIEGIARDSPESGLSFLILPATSGVHLHYAQHGPDFPEMFMKPIVGWVSGVALDDLGKVKPKVFNGITGESSSDAAIVMHLTLPAGSHAKISILNIFHQGSGDVLQFAEDGFSAADVIVNGKKQGFVDYVKRMKVDTKLPLVADFAGARINTSFQSVDEAAGRVNFYAPVFKGVDYKLASPVGDYVAAFEEKLRAVRGSRPFFACNCILNYLYGELEGKKTGAVTGPITFGEVAYQLLNQTLVMVEL